MRQRTALAGVSGVLLTVLTTHAQAPILLDSKPMREAGERKSVAREVSFTLEVIAQTGDEPPERPGETFSVFADPTIDGDGTVAFRGDFDGPLSGNQGIYLASPDSAVVRLVDDSFDFSPPGQSGATSWTAFGPPTIDPNGAVVFWGSFSFGDNSQGLYAFTRTSGSVIFDDDPLQPVPGHPTAVGFTTFPFSAAVQPVGADDLGSSIATFFDAGFASHDGLYTGSSSLGIVRVADDTLTPPGQPGIATFTSFGPGMAMNSVGDVVFQASYSGGGGRDGVYLFDAGTATLSCVADDSTPVPGQLGAASFTTFDGAPSINDDGTVVFLASYASGSGNEGIYRREASGVLKRVVDDSGDFDVPGHPSASFSTFGPPAIGGGGHVIFSTVVTGGPNGLYLKNGGSLRSVLDFNDPVPGQPGASYTAVSNPTINALGHVAVNARYSGGTGNEGLYFFDGQRAHRVLDESNTSLGLSLTNLHANLFTGLSGGQDGKPRFLNDEDSMTIRASLAGGDQAILRASRD